MFLFFKTILNFLYDSKYRQLLYTSASIVVIGALVYRYLEEWSWIDAFYFSIITLTTVGYGDFSPQTDAGKLFTIFYIILGIGMILNFINTMQSYYNEKKDIHNQKHNGNPHED